MRRTRENADAMITSPIPSTSFTASRVNDTTFLVIEDDSYGEQPYIYAKLDPVEHIMILSDTGCDSPKDSNNKITHLRQFLEEYPVEANGGKPLNPGPNRRSYVILCSHCHFDHILGLPQFTSSDSASETTLIIASEAGKSFIEDDLPRHSLCSFLEIPTPQYKVTHWAADNQRLAWPWQAPQQMSTPSRKAEDGFVPGKMDDSIKMDLNITLLQTPGHTPDSMAWYDERERHLYVGDTFYEGEIIFPPDGNWIHYMASLHKLLEFVRQENAATSPLDADEEWVQVLPMVKVGCAHSTSDVDGAEIIEEVITLFERIIAGKVPVMKSQEIRGELYNTWKEDYAKLDPPAKYKFSVRGPVRLCEEARRRTVKQVEKSFYFV